MRLRLRASSWSVGWRMGGVLIGRSRMKAGHAWLKRKTTYETTRGRDKTHKEGRAAA
jgi:hypothetical protein